MKYIDLLLTNQLNKQQKENLDRLAESTLGEFHLTRSVGNLGEANEAVVIHTTEDEQTYRYFL